MSDTDITTNKHLDEITLMLYVERQLDRDAAQEVSLHTQTCVRCMTLLRALDRESRLLTRSMLEQDEPLPARLAQFRARAKRSMQWIWGVVFGLAVLGGYALYTTYIEPWELQFEQAGFGGTNLLSLLVFQGAFWKGWQSMFTLVEFVALASVAGFALFAFRKYLRRGAALAVVFASMGLLAFIAGPVSAQDFNVDVKDMKKGASLEVKKDEVWNKDLFFFGQRLKVDGTVDGDVYTFAHEVDVSGHVTGDVICFAQTARITGQVDGNVRSFTNNITISGNVEKSVSAFNEVFNLDSNGKIGHSLLVFGQSLNLDGKLGRDLLAFFDQGSISGMVGGDVKAKGQSLTIASTAQIDGHTSFQGNKPAEVAAGARLAFPLVFKKMQHRTEMERGGGYYVWRIIWATAFILFGLVFLSLLPQFSKEAVTNVENVGASFGLGVLVGFAVPIAALIACVTVVGLFVGVSAFLMWWWALYFAQIIVGTAVGQWIMGRTSEFWPLIGRMAVGVVLVRLVMIIPYVGWLIKLGVIVWGVGALSLAVYRRLQPVIAPKIPPMPGGPTGTPLPSNTTVG